MNRIKAFLVILIPSLILIIIVTFGLIKDDKKSVGVNNNYAIGEIPKYFDGDLIMKSTIGEEVNLKNLNGKIVLIDFWSSWCAPCIAEAETLASTYNRWKDYDVEFIGVAIWDTQEDVDKFIKKYDVNYPIVIDDNGQIAVDFGVAAIPEKILIDKNGKIVKKILGPSSSKDLNNIISEISEDSLNLYKY
ncbi:MAG: hypothetical protein CL748_00950 [Chloroflexi bacterium]|nr:hypothetical protein [Chloroflexota bacterium]|tara:strand:+ start:37 stop:606 length:570 start_codon:yes stop_codon:yes gene_type:complete